MDPFLGEGSLAFTDEVTDAAARLLAQAGVSRLSIGVVAAGLGLSRQGLTQHLKLEIEDAGSRVPPAVFLHEIVVGRFGMRFVEWMAEGLFDSGAGERPRIAVPESPEERAGIRTWLALRELARADWIDGEPTPAKTVAEIHRELRSLTGIAVRRWLGHPVDRATLSRVLALADGVQIAAAAPVAPLSAVTARSVLDREIESLGDGPSSNAA